MKTPYSDCIDRVTEIEGQVDKEHSIMIILEILDMMKVLDIDVVDEHIAYYKSELSKEYKTSKNSKCLDEIAKIVKDYRDNGWSPYCSGHDSCCAVFSSIEDILNKSR